MKYRALIIGLTTLLLTGCAAKADAANRQNEDSDLIQMRETLASAQEVYVPEQDTNVVGSVSYYPNTGAASSAVAGSNCVSLFCQNNYVKANEGTISLFEVDTQRKVASIRAENEGHVVISEISQMGKDYTGFESGTQIDLYFDYPFEAGKSYFVLMDSACFKLGRIFSKAVTDAEVIVFRTKDYGFSGDWRSIYHTDELAFFDVVLGRSIDRAEVKYEGDLLSVANPVISREDIEAQDDPNGYGSKPLITFLQEGNPTIDILFYRGDEVVDSIQAGFEVVHPEVEIEEVEIVNHKKDKDNKKEENDKIEGDPVTEALAAGSMVVTTTKLNLRAQPSTETGAVVEIVEKGTQLTALACEGEWTKVAFSDQEVYCVTEYLLAVPSAEEEPEAQEEEEQGAG